MTHTMDRIIAHVDMDSFFTAVEVMDDPALRGRPVIVGADPKGGQGRGVVSAASYEARRFGVRSAMPISQAYRRCPQGVYLRGRMERYAEVSRHVMDALSAFTPLVEQVSIDEAFLDLSDCRRMLGRPPDMGRAIKREVRRSAGVTASVGIGPNKMTAKIASDLRKPDGLVIVSAREMPSFLAPLPVNRLWGVGPALESALQGVGIRTIGELAGADPAQLERRFGESARQLHARANGIDDDPVAGGSGIKSVGRETTFDQDTADPGLVRRKLLELCEDVAGRLRHHGVKARTVAVKIRYRDFDTLTRRSTAGVPTDATGEVWETARSLLAAGLQPGRPVRLIGVSASNFAADGGQSDLFPPDDPRRRKRRSADAAADEVTARFGERALFRAGRLERPGPRRPSTTTR